MKKANISYAKNNLSAMLRVVKEGGAVLLTDRRRPVAVLRPVENATGHDGDRVAELVRRGIAAPVLERLDPARLRRLPRPAWREGRPLTAHVAEDRESRA
jgi:antitoxin (DNA-binding transcriptional repressor) of toxin-antitoxin stability system